MNLCDDCDNDDCEFIGVAHEAVEECDDYIVFDTEDTETKTCPECYSICPAECDACLTCGQDLTTVAVDDPDMDDDDKVWEEQEG